MKTLLEIKDEVAQRDCGYNWDEAIYSYNIPIHDYQVDEVAKRYAQEALKEAAEKAAIKRIGNGRYLGASVDKESILNIELK